MEIIDDWVTIAEDGYLTLRFRTQTDGRGTRHALNLVNNGTAENPYVVELRHNAHGDICGYPADGLVAFSLDSLPDTQGKTVKLTLRWKAYRGVKTVERFYSLERSTFVTLQLETFEERKKSSDEQYLTKSLERKELLAKLKIGKHHKTEEIVKKEDIKKEEEDENRNFH